MIVPMPLLVAIALAVQQVAPDTARSVLYLGVLLTALNIIDKIVIWFRGGQAPVIRKIDEVERRVTEKVDKIERDIAGDVRAQRDHIDRSLDEFHDAVTKEVNGWGGRVEENRKDIDRALDAIETQARQLIEFKAESKADRAQINNKLSHVEAEVRGIINGQNQMELRFVHALGESERRLMEAIRMQGKQARQP